MAKGILTVAAALVTCLRLHFLKYSSDGGVLILGGSWKSNTQKVGEAISFDHYNHFRINHS